MKKLVKLCLGMAICSLFFSTNVFANVNPGYEQNMSYEEESILLPKDVNKDMDREGVARGRYISSSGLSISNEGYGVIGIYADTLAHVPVKKIRMNFYLERWDENTEAWCPVDHYNFLYEYEEGGEELTSVSESFSVSGFPTGCYYRLRGVHSVWALDGSLESQGPKTNGVWIKDGPA